MTVIPLPQPGTYPERWSAVKLLIAANEEPARIHRVLASGDVGARCDGLGIPRETILFETTADARRTAICFPDGSVRTWPGWTA